MNSVVVLREIVCLLSNVFNLWAMVLIVAYCAMESKMVSVMDLDKYQVDSVLLFLIITRIFDILTEQECVARQTQYEYHVSAPGFCVEYFGFVLSLGL